MSEIVFTSTPNQPMPYYDPFSISDFSPSEVLSQDKGGYDKECERCKRQFVGFKRQRYCATCQEYMYERDRADNLKLELDKVTAERDRLLSIIRGLIALLETYKEI